MPIEATAYARAGLVGNPSDGYFGKTIAFVFRDFSAQVVLTEAPHVEIVSGPDDVPVYSSVRELVADIKSRGYYGGVRLLKATTKRFADYCAGQCIDLADKGFSLQYRSTVPRHVGLAGSSALVTATLRCLMRYFEVAIPKEIQPNLIVSVENDELGIAAGLMDRVSQVYQGCVFMDFDETHMKQHGHGRYTRIDPALLPPLYIAYRTDLSEGSEVYHNNLRARWNEGDSEVVNAMRTFAGLAEETYHLLLAGRGREIGPILNANFDLRRTITRISPANIELVERARSTGASAKFSGSGGAIVGSYEDEAMFARLEEVFRGTGTEVLRPCLVEG